MKIAASSQQPILLASNNSAKLAELQAILSQLGLQAVSPNNVGIQLQVEETGATFAENAILKAEAYLPFTDQFILADDSGLVVDALDGAPGIYSARYGGPGLSEAQQNELVLQQLNGVPESQRTARFVAVLALARRGDRTLTFEGMAEGAVSLVSQGHAGFGYDPIFLFPPLERTFAQLTVEEKARVSHRGQALRRLTNYLAGAHLGGILDGDPGGGCCHETTG